MGILYLGLFIRIFVQYINLYIFPISGLNEDAFLFHFLATEFATNGFFSEGFYQDSKFYSYSIFLGYIYKAFNISNIFFGSLLNIFFWFISALVLYNTLMTVAVKKNICNYALLFYTFLPSSIFFSSSTFREPLILLFTNLIIYFFVKLFKSKNINYFFLILILLINYILATYLHMAYLYISIVFIIVTFFLIIYKFLKYKKTLFLFFFIFLFFIFFQIEMTEYLLTNLMDKSAIYKSNTTHGLTSYNYLISENNLINNFFAFVQFLVQPSFFTLSSYASYLIFLENIIKIFMIVTFPIILIQKNTKYNFLFIITFLLYLMITFIWSLGTTNWGTSIRHSYPQLGILIFFYFGNLNNLFLNKKIK
jgi:hypothetical protein